MLWNYETLDPKSNKESVEQDSKFIAIIITPVFHDFRVSAA